MPGDWYASCVLTSAKNKDEETMDLRRRLIGLLGLLLGCLLAMTAR
jgi:hypothetical protein